MLKMEPGKDTFKVNGVVERDIDLLLLEEFVSSNSFRTEFLKKTNCSSTMQFQKAEVSVVDETGRESDLVVWFKEIDETKLVFLIENKINAQMQHEQAEDYQKRARDLVRRGDADKCICVLVAPKDYPKQSDIFDHTIDYEEILELFRISELPDDRKSYKLSLLQSAIEKASKETDWGVTNPDKDVTAFWEAYWSFVGDKAPEFRMKKPGSAGNQSTYKYFGCAEGLPDGCDLVHKIMNWEGRKKSEVDFFDLQFSKTSREQLKERYGDRAEQAKKNGKIHDSIAIVKAGKSASIRVEVPTLDIYSSFEQQRDNCAIAVQRGRELLNFIGNK